MNSLLLFLAMAPADLPADKVITGRLNRYMSDAVQFDHFAGAVLVARKGKILLSKGFGMANAKLKIANKPSTRFRIGSVSKQFTAAAIMRLQEEGKLKTSDSISRHLKDTPAHWDGITIKHLLNHTSGLVNYTALPEASGEFLKVPHSHAEVFRLFRDKPLEAKPGEQVRYNNTGYFLLGLIVEQCSGESFGDYLRTKIFKPADLRSTGMGDEAGIALSYRVDDNGYFHEADFIEARNLFAIGGLTSTVEDLWKWEKALRSGKVLSQASLKEMFSPGKGGFGYGWIIDELGGQPRTYHDGGVASFSTSLQRLTNSDVTVIAISNRGEDGGIRVAYDTVGWLCNTPATLRGIQPELLTQSAEASFKLISEARQKFPIFDIGEKKVNELGNYMVISRKKAQAIELFKLNVMLYPKSSEAHYRLALNYAALAQNALARKHVDTALHLDPNHIEAAKLRQTLKN